MAKKAEPVEDNGGGGVTRWESHEEPVNPPTKYEFTVFLKDPRGAKTCVKAIGTAEVFDDLPAVIEALYVGGYEPDTFGQGAKSFQAQAPAQNGNGGQGGERPTKFQDAQGGWWYVNASKKKQGAFYAARKNKATGLYDYCPKDQIPQFVRDAYGASLS